ncbi:uncharacterized protein LOC136068588 [Quercus suber]|uniref:uncharacterized protein LOC136068588 n=1 Tax=Quercus suber TaxID=58331 RepID=UPI0032DE7499
MPGISFRGHDESQGSSDKGNFLKLVQFLGDHNESINEVLQKAPKNCKLTHPEIQKDIVNAIAPETSKAIIKDLDNGFFSILVDESRDISVKEQMAFVLRYVNKEGIIIERFLGIVHVASTTVLSLKHAIECLLCEHNLSLSKLHGQGYDGASNIQGDINGLKTLILKENKSAFYVHCFAHQLQLTLVTVAKNHINIAKFFYVVSNLVTVVGGSYKRRDALRDTQFVKIKEDLENGVRRSGQVIDMQLQELNNCFSEANTDLLLCIACLNPSNSFVAFDKEKLIRLAKFYRSDFLRTNILALDSQLQNYIFDMRSNNFFLKLQGVSELAEKLVSIRKHETYPLVYLLVKLALTLPVATATVERSFSAMKNIKNELCNRMGDQWMNDCLVVNWKTEFFFVSSFWSRHPVKVSRNPFSLYTRELGNLRPKAIGRPSLGKFHCDRVHRARLHTDRSYHSLVTLQHLAMWGLGPEPSVEALAHELTVRRRMATMKENKGKEVVDEATRLKAQSQPHPSVRDKRKTLPKTLDFGNLPNH